MELDELQILVRQSGACRHAVAVARAGVRAGAGEVGPAVAARRQDRRLAAESVDRAVVQVPGDDAAAGPVRVHDQRSEEHTSELQSLMRISYAVFCLKKKN